MVWQSLLSCSRLAVRFSPTRRAGFLVVLIQRRLVLASMEGLFARFGICGLIQAQLDSLIEHYPNFERTLRESLRSLVGEEVEKRVDIGMAKDGSGVGGKRSFISPLVYSSIRHFSGFMCAAIFEIVQGKG